MEAFVLVSIRQIQFNVNTGGNIEQIMCLVGYMLPYLKMSVTGYGYIYYIVCYLKNVCVTLAMPNRAIEEMLHSV